MASVSSSTRSKQWRAKRKDDEEFWEQERKRKREARKSRSEEKKQHDRELSKKRQKRFRERKKVTKCIDQIIPVDVYIVNDGSGPPAVPGDASENYNPAEEFDIVTVSSPKTFPVGDDMDSDRVHVKSVCESDGMEGIEDPVLLYNVNGSRWDEETKPRIKQVVNRGTENKDNTVDGGDGRSAYFERIQTILSEIDDFDSLQMECKELSRQLEHLYPIGKLPTLDVTGFPLDNTASTLYPHDDAPNDLVPIRTFGDGNCLPRIGSLVAFGNDKHHTEIRIRVFIELCLFENEYLDDSYLNRGSDKRTLNTAMTLAQYANVYVPRGEDAVRFAFRQYVKTILKKNSFNGMWSIFALASVLGVQIFSIYPSYGGYNVRPDLHRRVMPRVFKRQKSQTVHIMWTSTKGKQQEPVSWTPNHFVAVLPTHDKNSTATASEKDELPKQDEPSGTHVITASSSSTIPSDVLCSEPMGSLSSKYSEFMESPTSQLLNYVGKSDSTIRPPDATSSRTAVLVHNDPVNVGAPTPVNDTFLSHSDDSKVSRDFVDQHGTPQLRGADRCPLHPQEQLLYLCTTCDALPICYRCHLESHQHHTFEDLKKHLADSERIYLQQITKKHEEDLKEVIEQQKYDHVENMKFIDREIENAFEVFKEKLATWRRLQHEIKAKRDQKVKDQIQILESELQDTDKFTANACLHLHLLPVSKRLTVMTSEPQPEPVWKRHPRTHLVFLAGPDTLLNQFGTLAEMPYQTELSKTGDPMEIAYGSEDESRPTEVKGNIPSYGTSTDGTQHRDLHNAIHGHTRPHPSLTTGHELSGRSIASPRGDQTDVYNEGSTISNHSVPTYSVLTDTCQNGQPLMHRGLQDDQTFLASALSNHLDQSALPNHLDQSPPYGISAVSAHNYQPLNYGIPAVSTHKDQPLAQNEPSGTHVITASSSSTIPSDVLCSEPMGSLSSKYSEFMESPTFQLLNYVGKSDSTIRPPDATSSRTAVLVHNDPVNVGAPTPVNDTFLSHSDDSKVSRDFVDQHGTPQLRGADRCPLHPQEQLLYLCTTCDALPICYRCHLESHQHHTFEDLKKHLADSERIYLQQITKKHEEDLKEVIEQQKYDHVENMKFIDREIENAFEVFKEKLATWRRLQHEIKAKRDQKVKDQIQILESELQDTDKFTANACLHLHLLPVSKRLTVMTSEPQPEPVWKRHPRTHLVFLAGPDTLLNQFGTLAEMPYQTELSKTGDPMEIAYGSEDESRPTEVKGNIPSYGTSTDGTQHRDLHNAIHGHTRPHPSLTTGHELSGRSIASPRGDQTDVYNEGSTISNHSVPTYSVLTDTCQNGQPLMHRGLQDDQTFLASALSNHLDQSALPNHLDQSPPYGISAVSAHNYQPLNYGIPAVSTHKDQPLAQNDQRQNCYTTPVIYHTDQRLNADITPVISHNDQRLNSDITPMVSHIDQRLKYGIAAVPIIGNSISTEALRNTGGLQTTNQQHNVWATFRPDDSDVTETPINHTISLRHDCSTVPSEMETDTSELGTKARNKTSCLEYSQTGHEYSGLNEPEHGGTDNDQPLFSDDGLTDHVSINNTTRITHEISLPGHPQFFDMFCSVNNKLYVWKFPGKRVSQVSKSGDHNTIDVKSRSSINDICVSPVDNTIWYGCADSTVRL